MKVTVPNRFKMAEQRDKDEIEGALFLNMTRGPMTLPEISADL